MTGLWLAIMAIIAGTMGLLLMPLWRRPAAAPARGDFDAAVYRDQLGEVERDLERGALSAEQAQAARTEIQRRLLATADEAGHGATEPARPAWPLVAMAVLAAAGGLALYLHLGSPDAPGQPLAERPREAPQAQDQAPRVGAMVEALATRLAEDPDDLDGWLMLGRSYRVIERYGEAAEAFQRALKLGSRRPEILIAYGEAVVLAAEGAITEPARAVFEEALGKSPTDPRPRFYIAIGQTQQGDLAAALQTWVDLEAMSPDDAPWLADVRSRIRLLAEELGVDAASVKPTVSPPPGPNVKPAPPGN